MRPIVPFVKKQPHGSVIDDKTSVIRSRITAILLMIGLFMLNQAGYSQTANQYGFSTVGTASLVLDRNANTVNMTIGTTQLIGSSVDDQGSSVTNIGFTFTYFGTAYTQFSASSNGGIRLGGSAISGNTIGTSFPVSNQAIIAPYLQDIETNSTGKVHYKVIGTAPNRTLVVEFLNMRINFASSAANGTFQARLYERTNIIEFVYGAMAVGSTSNGGGSNADARNAVIGFSNTTGANNEFSVNQSSPYTTTTSSSPIVNVNGSTGNIAGLNSAADGLRRSFTFIPPTVNTSAISGSPFCPGAAVSVPFTSSGVFTSNTYTAQLSTAAGSFTGATTIGTLVSNANSGTINGFIDAGAIAGSLYRIRVISSNSNVLSFDNNTNLTVNANPAVSGPTAVCVGGTTTVTPTFGGTWGSSDNGIATVTDAGEVNGVLAGNATLTFTSTATGCTNTVALTVNGNATLGLTSIGGTDAQTLCVNTPLINITYLVGGTGTGASITAGFLPAGVTGTYNGGTKIFTIQGTPTASGSFSYTLTTTGPCGNTFLTGTIDVTASSELNLTSAPGTNTQTVCIENAINNITYAIGGNATGASLTAGSFPAGVEGSFDGDLGIFTISGTPTVSGSFGYTITSTGPCPVQRTGTIIVNANSTLTRTSGIGTDAQTRCISTALTNITYLVAGGGTGASITAGALPSGVTGTYNGGTKVFTIQGTPTASGNFSYTITTTGPCVNTSLSGTITVTANSTLTLTSGVGSNLQTVCQNSAISTITYAVGGTATGAGVTGLPAGVTGEYETGVFTISGTPTVSGSFNFIVTPTGPCSNPPLNGTITINPAPAVSLLAAPGSVCFTQNAILTATNSGGTINKFFSGTGGGVTIPNGSNTSYAYSSATLTAGSETLTSADLLQVTLNIDHNDLGDLDIFLVDPSGTRAILLTSDNGGSGNDYTNTVLSTAASTIIGTSGSAPYTGTYRPEGTITTAPDRTGFQFGGNYNSVVPANALDGAPINGTWTLRAFDDNFFAGGGSVLNWTLSITKANIPYTTVFSGPATLTPDAPTGQNINPTATVNAPVGSQDYTATTTDAIGCSTTSAIATVVVNPVPDAPLSGGNQAVCEDGNPLQTLTATATGGTITWYDLASLGSVVAPTQVGVGSSTYYAESSDGTCSSLTRTAVTLTINAAPAAPTASNQTVCSDGNPTQTLTATATGGTITWYDAALLGIVVPSPTQVGVGSVTYYAEANNGTCNSLTLTPVTLTINAVPDAPVSGGNQAVCEDGNPLQTLTATATGDNVTWYAAATGGGTVSPVQVGPGTSTYYAEASNGLCASLTRTPVTLTINAAPAAPTASNQTVCSDGNPTQTLTATATGGTITWYDAALLGSVVPSPTQVGVGSVTYHAEAFDGTCNSLTLTPVTLTINAVPDAPVSGGNQAVCEDGNPLQTLTATATGDNVTWYAAATGGGTVSPVQVGPGTSTYYAEASNGLCASLTRTPVTLTINAAPAAPTASNQSVCSNGNPLQTLTATATGGAITWYDEATNGNVVPVPTQVGVGAATYYAESSDGTCNSLTRTAVTLKINIPPAVPGPISGPVNVCPFANPVVPITYSIAPVPFAETYRWVLPVTVNLISASPDSTSITITLGPGFNDFPNKQIRVRSISSCGNSAERIFYMRADFPITPSPITGPSNICSFIESNTEATYVIPKVTAATAYIWTIPAGATATHPNGPGANDTIVTLSFGPTFVTSPITVRSTNDCGTSSARSFTIVRILPSTPGLITGPTNVCEYIAPLGGYGLYKIRKVPGVTSYTWTVPAGANMTHQNDPGVNDTAILVNFPANFNNGAISVISHNGCGTSVSPRFLSVGKLNPATPGMIDVIQLATCPNRQYSYTIANMPANATNVQWTVPASAVSFTGQGTTSIIVEYPSSTINGNVTATAYSNCGNSVTRAMQVKLPACPPPPPPAPFTGKPTVVEPGKPAGTETIPATMGVSIYPNPSTAAFNVQVITAGKELVKVRIMDLQGRTFKQISVAPFQKTTFGNELKAGTYIVEIIQGKDRITQKIVKL